jgi:indole-3-glycerol phosphate synthase
VLVRLGARIIGVNNRDLRDFSVDFAHAQRLRELVPSDRVFVAESGVTNLDDIATIARLDADAVLIGEFLMRSPHRGKLLNDMRAMARREQR